MNRLLQRSVLLIAACALAPLGRVSAEQLPTRAALFAPPDVLDVTISPDGRHLAFLALEGGRTNLWTAPLAHPAQARPLLREPGSSVFTYIWAGERLVYQTGRHLTYWTDNHGGRDYIIYVLDPADGSSRALTPPLDRRVKFSSSARGPHEIFVSPSSRLPVAPQATRIDLDTGTAHQVTSQAGLSPIYADERLEPRVAMRSAALGGIEMLVRPDGNAWRSQRTFSFAERLMFTVHGFDRRGRSVYVTHAGDRDAGALFEIDLATGRETLLAHRDGEEIGAVLLHPHGRRPIAYESGRLRSAWTVLDSRYEADFARLDERAASLAVPQSDLSILGRDARDRVWLVAFEADAMPRRYYAYERRSGEFRFLFSESRALDALSYAATRPVVISARDGLELVGYLTLPGEARAGGLRPEKPGPLVVWVHGGPQSRETWRFDAQAQWLASRGYAVLSVNYRGSTGFGKRFVEAGYGEWGRRMQDDLIDAAQWAIREHIADPDRIALLGLSYGGYATLSALAGAPGSFACGIETVGLSDLNLFLDTLAAYGKTLTDPSIKRDFDARMARDRLQLGGDERTAEGRAALAARSPLTHAAKIRVPLLITHGLRDDGVVPAHSERMVAALARNGAPVTFLTYPDEGHGLARPQNKISHAAIAEHFLTRCLGGRAAPFEDSDFTDSSVEVRAGVEYVPHLAQALARRTGGQ